MSSFSITLSEDTYVSDNEVCSLGTIVLDDSVEEFDAPLSYWTRRQYLDQWANAVRRIIRGDKTSAIVQAMYNPKTANFISWWPMYSVGEFVHVQNQILLMADLQEPFDETDLYKHIGDRETLDEDGAEISEWVVPRRDLNIWWERFGGL